MHFFFFFPVIDEPQNLRKFKIAGLLATQLFSYRATYAGY